MDFFYLWFMPIIIGGIIGVVQAIKTNKHNLEAINESRDRFNEALEKCNNKNEVIQTMGTPESVERLDGGIEKCTWKVSNAYHSLAEFTISFKSDGTIIK